MAHACVSVAFSTLGRVVMVGTRLDSRSGAIVLHAFSTLGRVVMVGTIEAREAQVAATQPFSTLGRVVMVGTAVIARSRTCRHVFQYPRSGRDGWNARRSARR